MGVRHASIDGRGRAVSSRERADSATGPADEEFPEATGRAGTAMPLRSGRCLPRVTRSSGCSTAQTSPSARPGAADAAHGSDRRAGHGRRDARRAAAKGVVADELRGFARGDAPARAPARTCRPPARDRHRRHRRRHLGQPESVDRRRAADRGVRRAGRQARQSLGLEPRRQRGRARGARPRRCRWMSRRRRECLAATGFTFLFAPHYHPAMRPSRPCARRSGVRTVFNILGPLTNPAAPPFHLIGAYQPADRELMARGASGMEHRAGVRHPRRRRLGRADTDRTVHVFDVRGRARCASG